MARPVVCDVCGESGMLDSYGLPPVGWIKIDMRSSGAYDPKDLCSVKCAEDHLATLRLGPPIPGVQPVGHGC